MNPSISSGRAKSAALFRAANLQILDYPFDAALASALSICDEAIIVVSNSEDDTIDWVISLQALHGWDRVKVAYQKFIYDRGWQERWWQFAASLTNADWLMYIDADECIHEDDAPAIRQLMADPAIGLIRIELCNFYGTAWHRQVKDTVLQQARLGRRSRGWQMQNWCSDEHPDWPACQMVYGGKEAHSEYQGDDVANGPMLYHYGHCRDAQALAISNAKHLAWYRDGDGLENGRIPEVEPWRFNLAGTLPRGVVIPFEGSHPAVMAGWLEDHAEAWQQLEAQCLQLA